LTGKVTVGLAWYWPCVTDLSDLSNIYYDVCSRAYKRERSTPPKLL